VNTWKKLRHTAAMLLAAGEVAVAAAQTVTYLTPVRHAATAGQRVAVRVETGDGQAVRPAAWPTERIDWLFVRAPGTQENRENVGPRDANGDFIEVPLSKPGATLIALDTKPVETTISGRQFKAFARRTMSSQAYEATVAGIADTTQVRTRRIESAKTLVRVADPTGKPASCSAVAQSKTGQAVEIRPLADPTMAAVGSDLPVRAYVGGDKLAAAKVLATCVVSGKTQEAITDSSGSCYFRIDTAGVWRVEFHHITPVPDDEKVDRAIYSATLTFETPKEGAGK
jgi:hypothetical protein